MLCCTAGTAAQEPDSVVEIDTIKVGVTRTLVPASRIPIATSILGKPNIQKGRIGLGLDESLAIVPGVFVSNRHNFSLGSRISIRGFGARAAFGVRGVRILMDGIPLTLADGQSTLNNLDLGAAGRIEVIRGPASSLYGNATGGVISVVTEDAPAAPFATETRITVGNYGTDEWTNLQRAQVKAGGTFATGDWILSASRLELAGYREHSATENLLFNSRVRHGLGARTGLQVVVNATDVPRADSPGSLPADSARLRPEAAWPSNVRTGSGESARQLQGGATLSHDGTAGHSELMLFALTRNVENPLPFAYIRIDRFAYGARASHNGVWSGLGGPAFWTLGADADAQHDDRREYGNDAGRPGNVATRDQLDRVTSIGPFAQIVWQIASKLDVLTGLRYDRIRFATDDHRSSDADASGSRTLSAWSPVAGVTFTPDSRVSLFANTSTAFQTPTTTELINRPPGVGEPCCPGGFNLALEPQRARGYEIGLRGGTAVVAYEIAWYRMTIRDELAVFQVPEAEGRDFFRNLGRSRHTGLELLLGWHASAAVSGTLAYTLNDLTVLEDQEGGSFAGSRIPGVPRHQAAAQVVVDLTSRLSASGDVRYQGEMFVDDANTVSNDAATVADIRLGYHPNSRSGLRIYVGASNLFATRYNSSVAINAFGGRYFEPAPGRAWHLSLEWAPAAAE